MDDTTLHTLPPLAKKGGRVGLGPRQGRRLRAFSSSMLPVSQVGEALMEIINGKDPSPKSKQIVPVFVGEDVTLVVSTKVTRKLLWRTLYTIYASLSKLWSTL